MKIHIILITLLSFLLGVCLIGLSNPTGMYDYYNLINLTYGV